MHSRTCQVFSRPPPESSFVIHAHRYGCSARLVGSKRYFSDATTVIKLNGDRHDARSNPSQGKDSPSLPPPVHVAGARPIPHDQCQ
jgi:hypothetical protein